MATGNQQKPDQNSRESKMNDEEDIKKGKVSHQSSQQSGKGQQDKSVQEEEDDDSISESNRGSRPGTPKRT